MKTWRYAVVIERRATSVGAYVPDLPGCVAVGRSTAEVTELLRAAVTLHLQGMEEDGLAIPEPTTEVVYVDVGSDGTVLTDHDPVVYMLDDSNSEYGDTLCALTTDEPPQHRPDAVPDNDPAPLRLADAVRRDDTRGSGSD